MLASLIDYAGLFPPALMALADATRVYDGYLASNEVWMLGRFVIPATRLVELEGLLRSSTAGPRSPWRVSALLTAPRELDLVAAHNERSSELAVVDCIEMRAGDVDAITTLAAHAPADFERYVELAPTTDLPSLLAVARAKGVFAKIRTGGVTADAFPSTDAVLGFMVACRDAGVPFKATAGLHHAVHGKHPFTYAPDAASGAMFGFLNIVIAASAIHGGADPGMARVLLEARRADDLEFTDHGLRWGGWEVPIETMLSARAKCIRSVGSCSFREPLDDLRALGIR